MFGHSKGAFSGAVSDRAGKFELTDGGTIFLDEIGELPLSIQAKMLRTLQEYHWSGNVRELEHLLSRAATPASGTGCCDPRPTAWRSGFYCRR